MRTQREWKESILNTTEDLTSRRVRDREEREDNYFGTKRKYTEVVVDGDDFGPSGRVGCSKLALIHLARELARRYPSLTTVAVHPGRILTGMATSLAKESLLVRYSTPIAKWICVPVSVGIRNHSWAATSAEVVSGKYYEPVGVPDKESKVAKDEELSSKVWKWMENELKLEAPPSLK
ncbi:hypothetical protein GGS20DRAFT_589328 [Poronia punctata]|nr:hypothetical protein GGS20DRAFT_589328 [Poronia punctata]